MHTNYICILHIFMSPNIPADMCPQLSFDRKQCRNADSKQDKANGNCCTCLLSHYEYQQLSYYLIHLMHTCLKNL